MDEIIISYHPLLGTIETFIGSALLGLPHQKFKDNKFKIEGLCEYNETDLLRLIALVSEEPNIGNFHRFIQACKSYFNRIEIVAIKNPWLEAKLIEYNFKPLQEESVYWSKDENKIRRRSRKRKGHGRTLC